MVVTNAMGAVFTAALLSASQTGVTFVFSEDGATNELAWAQLSPVSREAVSEASGFAPVPPSLVATFRMADREQRKLEALAADGRLEPAELARRRAALRAKLERKCRDQGLSDKSFERILASFQ